MALSSKLRHLGQRIFFKWRYLGSPPWDTGVSPPELYAFIESRPPGKALDLGCGTGTNAITLARAGWEVTGVDFVGSAIVRGRQKARQAGVKVDLRQGDVTRLNNISGPFDLILDIGCFHSLSEGGKIAYITQVEELLAPQGVFLLYGFISTAESSNSGIRDQDLETLAQRMECIQRIDGKDRRRSSAWFTYRLK